MSLRAALALCLGLGASTATAECRQALVLALDVSGSVDAQEYRLQRDGTAAALESEAVQAALLSGGPPVALSVFEWSGPGFQRVLVPWQMLSGPDDIAKVAGLLRNGGRAPAPEQTALGDALVFAADLLTQGPDCPTRTIDVSGDGKSRAGPRPDAPSVRSRLQGITVNGLTVGSDDRGPQDTRAVDVAELSAYFRAQVITGPDAFVQVAIGYQNFAEAMERKLLREIRVLVLGRGPDPEQRPASSLHAQFGQSSPSPG